MATNAMAPMGAAGLMMQPGQPPQAEHTPSDPMQGTADLPQNNAQLSKDDQDKVMALVRHYKDQWSEERRLLVERCLTNLEFFKGNQYISFTDDGEFFNALDWIGSVGDGVGGGGHEPDADDTDLYRYCNNFYQMLATGFVAALAPQVPKSKWMPEDAEQLTDVTTAKAAQTLIGIIERQNREQSLLRQQLLMLYCTGAVFRHTRYIISADRAGTKTQDVTSVQSVQLSPDRWHCFDCGEDTPAGEMDPGAAPNCRSCGSNLGQESFYPGETGDMVVKTGTKKVPQGMVAQNLYSPLEVDCDPSAKYLAQTPILNLEVEIHLGSLRASYPDMYDQIVASATSELSANGSIDRIARQQVYAQGYTATASSLTDQRPTLSRSWIQPWAFDLEDDRSFGERMRAAYPEGLLLVSTGPTFLAARPAALEKEWTWAGTHEGFGLYPPSIGDIVVPFQKRYNDMANILHEFMDRCSSGVTLANADLIDTKSMQGKPLLPGVLNLVKLRKSGPGGAARLADALYQFQFQMHQEMFNYLDKLAFNAQMFAGIPPQVYGGQGDDNIQTFGGQQQQLNTALGKLNIYWDNLKEEHAKADELAVECAKDNLTEDMRQVIQEKGSSFRNEYVRLDDLQGSVHAYADTDQGLPVTAAELRQRWMDLMEAAAKNPVAQAIFDDPTNQEQAASAMGVPSMVIPGTAMRMKVLEIIDELQKMQPLPVIDPKTGAPAVDPNTGQPQLRSPIQPDKDIDDFKILRAVVRQYCQENRDLARTNPMGLNNILLYLTAATAMETAKMAEAAQQQTAAAPKPPPDPTKAKVGQMIVAAATEAVQGLERIGATGPLPPGAGLTAQVSACKEILTLASQLID